MSHYTPYSVTKSGEVYRDGKPIQTFIIKGYLAFNCSQGPTRKSLRVHREVAKAHVPNPKRLPCVRHFDGNTLNNNAANLFWGTYKENEEDKRRHGRLMEGIKHHKARLIDADIYFIRSSGLSSITLAAIFGVRSNHIDNIKAYRAWRHLD
jgi:hypothetical protein